MKNLITLILFSFITNLSSFAQNISANKTVIKNVNVIPVVPSKPEIIFNQDVFIENGIIKKISPSSAKKSKGYNEVDGTNKFLIPGMADMHVHLPNKSSVIQNKNFLLLSLLSGITTIRQMRGKPDDLVLRDSVKKGLLTGPDMFISTPFFRTGKTFSTDACRDSIIKYKQQGYDFVKYLYGLSPSQYDTLVSISSELNMKLTGHAPNDDLEKAVNSNQLSIEHIDPFLSLYKKDSVLFWKTIDKMADKHLFHCPNLYWYIATGLQTPLSYKRNVYEKNEYGIEFLKKDSLDDLIKNTGENYMESYGKDPVAFANYITHASEQISTYKSLLGRIHDRGIKLLISATSGDFIIPGYNCIDEMKLFVEAGISPFETIKCATYNAADCLNETDKWGTVSENKRANLVLLSANPLDNIENLRKVDITVVNGKFLTRENLLKELKSK